jgi:hypothetical protein
MSAARHHLMLPPPASRPLAPVPLPEPPRAREELGKLDWAQVPEAVAAEVYSLLKLRRALPKE